MRALRIIFSRLNLIKFGLLLFSIFPLIPNKIKGFPVIYAFIFSLILYLRTKKKKINWNFFLINSGIFSSYIFSLLYTSNLKYAIKNFETSLSLLITPLVFALIWGFKDEIDFNNLKVKIISVFYNVVFLYSIIVCCYLLYIGRLSYLNDPNFFRHFIEFLPLIGQHSIYASIFLSLGLLFSINLFNLKSSINSRISILLKNIVISILLVSLASKGVLLATFITVIFYCLSIIKKNQKRILIILLIIFLGALSIKFSPSLSKRISSFKLALRVQSNDGNLSSTQTRKEIYICSLEALSKNWVFGYGIGDVKDTLMECYKNTSEYLTKGEFNTHNQYLSILLSSGLVGLFLLFIFLFYNLRLFIKSENYFFFSVFIFYLITMFFENILERQSGVILFSFLINFFSFISFDKSQKNKSLID